VEVDLLIANMSVIEAIATTLDEVSQTPSMKKNWIRMLIHLLMSVVDMLMMGFNPSTMPTNTNNCHHVRLGDDEHYRRNGWQRTRPKRL
jgi:hypothetical protein